MALRIRITPENDASEAIAGAIRALSVQPELVRIDGESYAGKSRLARKLAARLNAAILHVDDYLASPLGHRVIYPDIVDRSRLLAHLRALSGAGVMTVLEGLWLEASAPPAEFGNGYRILVRVARSALVDFNLTTQRRLFRTGRYGREYQPAALADVIATRMFV